MKEQTHFHIPTPCHEDWDNMTPQDKGRFCTSCSKQVVDFSLMSDQQVLNYFKNSPGKVCGRFANDQLQRPMIETPQQKKKVWWVAAMMPLLLVFGKATAQKKRKVPELSTSLTIQDTNPMLLGKVAHRIYPVLDTISEQVKSTEKCFRTMGDTIITHTPNELIIKGTIIEENSGDHLPFASIFIKDSKLGVAADINGGFSLSIKDNQKLPTLVIASVGYQTKEIDLNKDGAEIISRINKSANTEEIFIKPEITIMQQALSGVVVVCRKPKHIDTAKTTIKKILNAQEFKIFPNPVEKGSILKLEIKKPGDYSAQILDNNGSLILVQDFHPINDNLLMDISIPAYINPGMYYIRLIDNNKKKQYTDKLIVQ